jgi:hypothetical protein
MTLARLVFVAAIVSGVAACAGPAPNSTGYSSYGGASGAFPSVGDSSHLARLTPPNIKITLATLPGMNGDDLVTRLGAPQFRRRDGQAEIWQYRGSACTLDVFLYYADGANLIVRYVETRGHDTNTASNSKQANDCASALIDSRVSAGRG